MHVAIPPMVRDVERFADFLRRQLDIADQEESVAVSYSMLRRNWDMAYPVTRSERSASQRPSSEYAVQVC